MAFVIGDVAGEFDALMRLLKKANVTEDIILVGDLIDRGPKSKEVIQWCIDNSENVDALMGNHEHMFLDHLLNTHLYEKGVWYQNGGGETMKSYGLSKKGHIYGSPHKKQIILEHRAWLRFRPLIIERDGFTITHAPINPLVPKSQCIDPERLEFGESVIWNRSEPKRIEGTIQLFGHNADHEVRYFMDGPADVPWAICLDTSYAKKLTGINTKTMEIFQEPYEEITD